ncbi:unnamed protein product [Trichogramma brassicae]|uniref:Uncharacterized protein n=1 Tax=Trichogramma brassicae TaxID=86971 RepID=A0A6H5IPB7_9HYME|nr:unnamed protein product [Trichogramma brassicae]
MPRLSGWEVISWKKLKRLRGQVNWNNEDRRFYFFSRLQVLIEKWSGRLPDLGKTLRREEIDWILTHCTKLAGTNCQSDKTEGKAVIDFVISTGYQDQPAVHHSTSLHRPTALHRTLKNWHGQPALVRDLFRIYSRFDVNYHDDEGLTHFHVACAHALDDIVKKFLELGQVDPNCLVSEISDPPLHLSLSYGHKRIVDLLLRNGADPNLANAEGLTPLHLIVKSCSDNDELIGLFFKIVDEIQRTVQINAQDKLGQTALHYALLGRDKTVVELLLRNGADPNLANVEGLTPLHLIVKSWSDNDELIGLFFKIVDEIQRTVQINAQDKLGHTALHCALLRRDKTVVELLLRNGADPNLATKEGSTPLHIIAKSCSDNDELAKTLFELSDEKYHPVPVNAQDMSGETPLLLAMKNKNRMLVELLLKNGADPNLSNKKGFAPLHIACKNDREHEFEDMVVRDKLGWTPVPLRNVTFVIMLNEYREMQRDKLQPLLHTICNGDRDNVDLAKMLFELSSKKYRPVQVNAQDKKGNTPLHAALAHGCKNMFELLLRNGADPNLANAVQVTPLRICLGNDDLLKIFLEINDDALQAVQVDALDKEGRTPLQWAVTSLKPGIVDLLLNHGADLSNFVFPNTGDFYKYVKILDMSVKPTIESKLKVTSGILGVIESLEKRGHELDLSDVLSIMMFLICSGLFEMKVKFDESWLEDENFASESKKLMIIPSMSLYDFVRQSTKKADGRLTYANYFRFLQKHYNQKERFLPEGSIIQTCAVYLCEQLVRRFLRSWALDCFMELIHHRLPILCCEMIIDNLMNKDLRIICLAAKRLSP